MREKYWCYDCEAFCEPETAIEYVTSEFWGSRETTRCEYPVCPTCGCDVQERVPCERCGDALPLSGHDYCGPCLIMTEES
jgi:hypothetical protein